VFAGNSQESFLKVPQIYQQDSTWCWAACMEMIFRYFDAPKNEQGAVWTQQEIVLKYLNRDIEYLKSLKRKTIKAGITEINLLRLLQLDFGFLEAKMKEYLDWEEITHQIGVLQQPILIAVNEKADLLKSADHVVVAIGCWEYNNECWLEVLDPKNPSFQSGNRYSKINYSTQKIVEKKICHLIYNLQPIN
jgi:hypothetical protein